MKILHISPHYGGGIGTVVSGWIKNDSHNAHRMYSLELCKEHKVNALFVQMDYLRNDMKGADIVLVHYWDKPILIELFSHPIPDCRLVFWLHKNTVEAITLPVLSDMVIKTSPVQGAGKYIWSTGDMQKFLDLKKVEHEGFNVGTVVGPKLHPNFINMCKSIKRAIPKSYFTILGDVPDNMIKDMHHSMFRIMGKVDDVAPYLAEMDVFFYPLRSDHYGTCEQVLGEAMAAGVVPVVMDNPAERLIYSGCKTETEYIEGIEFLYWNPGARGILSEVCRERAREIYSLDTMIKQWDEVFTKTMEKPKVKRGVL